MSLLKLFLCIWILGLTLYTGSVSAQISQSERVQFEQASLQIDDGNVAFKQRNFDQALVHYRAALPLGNTKQRATAYGNIGLILLVKGRFDESVHAFDEAIRLEGDHALAYGNRGVALEKLNRFQEALADYNMALKLKPDDALFLSYRADYFYQKELRTEALADYQKLVALKPDHVLYLTRLGILLNYNLKFKQALKIFNRALVIEPQNVNLLFQRGTVFASMRNPDAAIRDFSNAISLQPDEAVIYAYRANLFLEKRRLDEALQDLQTAQKLKPGLPETHAGLSRYWLIQHNADMAIQEAELAIKLNPDFETAYWFLAEAFMQKEDYEKALKNFDHVLSLVNHRPEINMSRASTLLSLGREQEALLEMKTVASRLSTNRERAQYESLWAKHNILHRNWADALPHATEAVRLAPQSSGYQFTLGEVLQQLGKDQQALTAYQKSCQLGFSEGCKRVGVGTP